jgi:hypothetical protein
MKKIIILSTLLAFIALPVLAQSNTTTTPGKMIGRTVIIRGELTEIAETALQVKKNSTIYQVILTEKTKFVRKFGGKSKLSEFTVGDTVQVTGKKIAENTIEAQIVRDISIQKRRATFEGKVVSIDSTAKSFVLRPNARPEQTVFVDEATKIIKNGQKITFAEIMVGGKVNVSGIWNTKNNTLMAERIVVRIERFVIQGKITAVDSENKTVKVSVQTATPKNLENQEVTINLNDETKIWRLGKKWIINDLAVDQRVIVKGVIRVETLTAQQILVIGLPKKTEK